MRKSHKIRDEVSSIMADQADGPQILASTKGTIGLVNQALLITEEDNTGPEGTKTLEAPHQEAAMATTKLSQTKKKS